MPRKPRLDLVGVAQHIVQRGHNREVCFARNEDFAAYAHWLKEAAERANVDVHAWVFMTNHVHFLATPQKKGGVSRMMQYIGGRYVPYFNFTYKRSGTLWEGRFKSSLIDSEEYLLKCYRYIELNPVRAGMVKQPDEYKWSSYAVNALGVESDICSPHPIYLSLGKNKQQRNKNYRSILLFCTHLFHGTKKALIIYKWRQDEKSYCNYDLIVICTGKCLLEW